MHMPAAAAGVLTRFEAAKRALAEAKSVDEVKQVRDQAEALRLYVKQQGESLEMQNAVAEIKLRAERKAGDLLATMPKHNGDPRSHDVTRLADLGIGKMKSSRWQMEATIPEQDFDQFVHQTKEKGEELTSRALLDLAREKAHQDRRQEREAAARAYAAQATAPDDQGILVGDLSLLWKTLEDSSVDLFLTDPPYGPEAIELYPRLAELAAAKLKPGGLCLAYAGVWFLPDVMRDMEKHLSYWWMFSLRLTAASMEIWVRYIHQRWKPIVAYGRPPLTHAPVWLWDSLDGGGREKDLHEWQQDLFSAKYLVEKLTSPGDLIVDPFCGAGTIPLACKILGRKWIATEIDADTAADARHRLATWQPDEMPLFEGEAVEGELPPAPAAETPDPPGQRVEERGGV
jgi:hypothetical protein